MEEELFNSNNNLTNKISERWVVNSQLQEVVALHSSAIKISNNSQPPSRTSSEEEHKISLWDLVQQITRIRETQ